MKVVIFITYFTNGVFSNKSVLIHYLSRSSRIKYTGYRCPKESYTDNTNCLLNNRDLRETQMSSVKYYQIVIPFV